MMDSITRLSASIGDRLLPTMKSTVRFIGQLADDIRLLMDFEFSKSDMSNFAMEMQNFQQSARNMSLKELRDELELLEGKLFDAQQGVQQIDFSKDFNIVPFVNDLDDANITISEWTDNILGIEGVSIIPFNTMMDGLSDKASEVSTTLNIDVAQINKQIKFLRSLVEERTPSPQPERPDLPTSDMDEPDTIEEIEAAEGSVFNFRKEMEKVTDQLVADMPTYERWTLDIEKSTDVYRDAATGLLSVANAIKTVGDSSASESRKFGAFVQLVGSIMTISDIPAGAFVTAVGSLFGHTGGLITDNGIQRFAHGGIVQGQDNVPIMAQAGEFIMKRESVQSIGVDQLAQMNRTGSAGVTINVQGNMIGNESFVRDVLIPEINNAQRLNLA